MSSEGFKFVQSPKDYSLGRDKEIKEIKEYLDEESIVFLNGEDGVGKLETALIYAKEYGSNYDLVYTVEDCYYSFEELAMVLTSVYNQQLNIKQIRSVFSQSPMKWLIIFKDMGDINQVFIESFPFTIEKKLNHHMIFVNSKPECLAIDDCPTITIQPLSKDESIQLIKDLEIFYEDLAKIEKLSEISRGNPQLIHQFADYLKKTNIDLEELLQKLSITEETKTNDILKKLVELVRLEVTGKSSELLDCLVYFDEFPIHSDWLVLLQDDNLKERFTANEISKAVQLFKELGIATLLPKEQGFEDIDRFVPTRSFLRALREINVDRQKELMDNTSLVIMELSKKLENNSSSADRSFLARHLFYFFDNSEIKNVDLLIRSDLCTACVEILNSNPNDAIVYGFIALQLYNQLPLTNHKVKSRKAHLLKLVGLLNSRLQAYDLSLKTLKESRDLYEQLGEETPVEILATLELNIGFAHLQSENEQDALTCFLKTVELLKDNTESIDYAKALNNLGVTYSKLGGDLNYKKSVHYHKKAVVLFKQHFGEDHVLTITNYQNLAIAYGVLGDKKRSKHYIDIVLSLLKRLQIPQETLDQTPKQLEEKIKKMKEENDKINASNSNGTLSLTKIRPQHILISGALVAAAYVFVSYFTNK
ncbi:hypothetical protein DLAC_05343 [Tieghemostelium lacteum]|uniref:Uncharacterized protein n=1 Tax=Tieghemostelium lacteum TaxID=361077 RepID=A0A151ZFL9_TIELA|nr:hypothetical protein DLAC_05343 [Tieghemostelium lacteum]|eukprot:KYQ92766.1 hypothetical protein DLAC_05343 [Tieghemostelium lacteum]